MCEIIQLTHIKCYLIHNSRSTAQAIGEFQGQKLSRWDHFRALKTKNPTGEFSLPEALKIVKF